MHHATFRAVPLKFRFKLFVDITTGTAGLGRISGGDFKNWNTFALCGVFYRANQQTVGNKKALRESLIPQFVILIFRLRIGAKINCLNSNG